MTLALTVRQQAVTSTLWPYLRAALITLVMASQCVSAFPQRPLDAEQLARPEAQRNLRRLGRVLRPLGERDPAELEHWVTQLSRSQVALRSSLLAPVAPLIHATAVRQQWHLFLTAKDRVYRLRIDAKTSQRPETWQTLYSTNQTDVLGLADVLDYRRLRAIYSPSRTGVSKQYPAFVDWLMQRVWSEHSELSALRVGLEPIELGRAVAQPPGAELAYAVERERPEQP
jgi:hypothetical protein